MDSSLLQIISNCFDPKWQRQAAEYLNHLKESEEGWQLCAATLSSEEPAGNHAAQFFCLQVLEHYIKTRHEKANQVDRQSFHRFLLNWLRQHNELDREWPGFLSNKVAQVLALMFVRDYPHHWNTFFSDLLAPTSDVARQLDLYLRILMQIDSEVVDRDIPHSPEDVVRNTNLKDAMRVHCIPLLVDSWMQIITTYQSTKPDLVNSCLDVIGAYVSWIDIHFIANDQFVPILLRFFGQESLRNKACSCVLEIINKGMDPMAKMTLIESFTDLFSSAGVLAIKEDDDTEYLENLSKLVNGMGLQLIASWHKLSKANDTEGCQQILNCIFRKLQMMKYFLAHEDDDVSAAVKDFAHDFLTFSKQLPSRSSQHKDHIQEMLRIVTKKMMYDESYNFEHEGEDEADFLEYRKALKTLFNNIGAQEPELLLQVVQEQCTTVWSSWQSANFQEVELSIALLYQLVEALPHRLPSDIKRKRVSLGQAFSSDPEKRTAVQQLMRQLITSNVSHYQHPAIPMQFFETVVRYDRFFSCEPDFVPTVLKAFLDGRGLRNSAPRVCSRTAYLFSRFVKNVSKPHLQPHLEEVLTGLQDLLALDTSTNGVRFHYLTSDDQMFLYETTGVLIVHSTLPPQNKQALMRQLLSNIVGTFDGLLGQLQAESNPNAQLVLADCLAKAMGFASRASKGFSNHQTMSQCGCVAVFTDVLEKFLHVLQVQVHRQVLHTALRQFLHRMVVCLDEEILTYLPVAMKHLLSNPEAREIYDFMPLLSQVVQKHKKKSVVFLSEKLMELLETIFAVLNSDVHPDDKVTQTENEMLQRAYFAFLHVLVANEAIAVLENQDPANQRKILQTLTNGAVTLCDPQCLKPMFIVLRQLVQEWVHSSDVPQNSDFVTFVYKEIIPACFLAPNKPGFDLNDGKTSLVLKECALCWKIMADKLGAEFYNHVKNDLFPSYNLSPELAQEFCAAVQSDPKVFKQYLKSFYEHFKR